MESPRFNVYLFARISGSYWESGECRIPEGDTKIEELCVKHFIDVLKDHELQYLKPQLLKMLIVNSISFCEILWVREETEGSIN